MWPYLKVFFTYAHATIRLRLKRVTPTHPIVPHVSGTTWIAKGRQTASVYVREAIAGLFAVMHLNLNLHLESNLQVS